MISFTTGLVLLGVGAVMIMLARSRDGIAASVLRVRVANQLYTVTSLICIVTGVTLLVITWP